MQCRGDGAALAGCRSPCWGFSQQPSKARVEEKDKKGYLEFRKTFRNKLFYIILPVKVLRSWHIPGSAQGQVGLEYREHLMLIKG